MAGKRGWKHSEEVKQRIAESARLRWTIPSIKKRMIDGLKKSQAKPAVRAKISASQKRYHAARRAAGLKTPQETEAGREARRVAMTRYHAARRAKAEAGNAQG